VIPLRHFRCLLLISMTLGVFLPPSLALLNIDGTRNQLFVFGNLTFAYSSNLFSQENAVGDYSVNATAGMELKRRAGIISVDSTFKVDYTRFGTYSGENALNPSFFIEFSKATGRTTGSITLSAFRETRSDNAVNLRTSSWNFPLGLNLKYPINDKFYATSGTSYLSRRYTGNPALASSLTDYSESLDLFYVYTSKLDLVGGYRLRVSRNSLSTGSTDHWFNFGASGGILAKLNGTVRIGYQLRNEQSGANSYHQFNAMAGLGWPVSRKLSLAGQISRDFNTIATGASVDSTNVSLRATYTFSRKLEFDTGVAYGYNHFLGASQGGRVDQIFSWDIGARYRFNEHLSLAASYSFFRNSSNVALSDFDRQGYSLDISSRF
jgi:hypothetical protein